MTGMRETRASHHAFASHSTAWTMSGLKARAARAIRARRNNRSARASGSQRCRRRTTSTPSSDVRSESAPGVTTRTACPAAASAAAAVAVYVAMPPALSAGGYSGVTSTIRNTSGPVAPRPSSTESSSQVDPARLTVAVVTRDRVEVLERFALPSLRAAAASGVDVVVFDQSSGDATRRAVAAAGLRYVQSPPGLSRGRNIALDCIESELVAFIDDDVSFDVDWPGRVQRAFATADRVAAVCGRGRTDAGRLLPGSPAGVYRWPASPFGLGSGFNLAVDRRVARELGGFNDELGAGARFRAAEDTDLLYRVLRGGWLVVCSDDVDVVHHEWRSRAAELSLHFGYGLGAGAQTALHHRSGDRAALAVAGRELRKHGWTFIRALAT